jgi:LysR family glycine cleavage system transcriptional activator
LPQPFRCRREREHRPQEDDLLAAALGGQGVALASPILFARELAAGLLVRPFRQTVSFHTGYYLVWPEGRGRSPKIKRFRDWLVAQAEADPAILEARAVMPA